MQARVGSFAGNPAEVRDNYKTGVHMIVRALYNLEDPADRRREWRGGWPRM
jgi:hypothetical protein